MNFINYAERAGFVDAAFCETEINESTSGTTKTTTIYAGSPVRKNVPATPPFSENANGDLLQDGGTVTTVETWMIRRTIITETEGSATTISQKWAEGAWDNRASLTYNYQ